MTKYENIRTFVIALGIIGYMLYGLSQGGEMGKTCYEGKCYDNAEAADIYFNERF